MESPNKAVLRPFYAAFNTGRVDELDTVFDADWRDNTLPPGRAPGLAGIKQAVLFLRSIVPDLSCRVEDLLADGDKVVARVVFEGTNLGGFPGVGPNGAAVSFIAFDVHHLFLDDPQHSLRYNSTAPDTDLAEFGPLVAQTTADLVRRAGTASDPEGHGRMVAKALLPDLIPFDPTLPASFGFAGINGRGLRDDFGAVVYSTIFNHPMRTALPPLADLRAEWPYLSPPRPLPTLVQVPPRG